MGTLGCVPAYDRYFIDGIKDRNVSMGNYNLQSLLKLVDFYEKNSVRIEEARQGVKVYDMPYPQMKLLDMGFWQIGFGKDTNMGFWQIGLEGYQQGIAGRTLIYQRAAM